jgi:hypothetical protein
VLWELSVVEQRYTAITEVLGGMPRSLRWPTATAVNRHRRRQPDPRRPEPDAESSAINPLSTDRRSMRRRREVNRGTAVQVGCWRGGLKPGPCCFVDRGRNHGRRSTWGSRIPRVTARARRGPAASDAARTQHGPAPLRGGGLPALAGRGRPGASVLRNQQPGGTIGVATVASAPLPTEAGDQQVGPRLLDPVTDPAAFVQLHQVPAQLLSPLLIQRLGQHPGRPVRGREQLPDLLNRSQHPAPNRAPASQARTPRRAAPERSPGGPVEDIPDSRAGGGMNGAITLNISATPLVGV